MTKFEEFEKVIYALRGEDGCPWDKVQTHVSLKNCCIEEAAEVICGINILEETGNSDNLKEELGDLLMQVVMHAQIAESEGLFTMDDVLDGIIQKMIRRHPHVFGDMKGADQEAIHKKWDEIKTNEKQGKEWMEAYFPSAIEESKNLLDVAKKRKEDKIKLKKNGDN